MAPTKEGLDYFPFDVDLLDNDDLDFLREKYGVVVNDVYIALLTLLYRKKGYYVPYSTAKEREECIWYIHKRVRGGKYSIQQEVIPEVIEALVARGLFSGDHFSKIITSERAQRTYYSATVERKLESFNIKPEYWLLSDETMRKLSKKHPYYLFLRPESKSDEKPSKSNDYQDKSDEKSTKKSKVNITSNEVIEESKKEKIYISKKQSSEPPIREDGTYDMKEVEDWEKHRSHASLMDELHVTGQYREVLENFLRYCYLNGHIITNDKLIDIICRLQDHYGNDEVPKIKSLNRAMSGGYYDIKEK